MIGSSEFLVLDSFNVTELSINRSIFMYRASNIYQAKFLYLISSCSTTLMKFDYK